jgi:stage II sporulation protein GA (sporulation sigma-E factor processing peptidase)
VPALVEVYYWDVAVVLFFCTLVPWLWATARLAGHRLNGWRIGIASLVGSVAGALWDWASWRSLPGALIGSVLLLWIAFGRLRPARLVRTLLTFLVIGATTAGLSILGAWQTGLPSVGVLIGIVLMAGGVPWVWRELLTRASNLAHRWQVRLALGDRTICLDGLVDTGHQLRDPWTGTPVILAAPADLRPLLGQRVSQQLAGPMAGWDQLTGPLRGRVRPVPFRTVAGEGLLPAFRPDGLWLRRDGRDWAPVEALVGIAAFGVGGRGDYQVLLPPLFMESASFKWEVERR